MKFLFIFLFATSICYTQGFDWEESYRMPFEVPRFFVGVNADFSSSQHTSDLTQMEGIFPCAEFKNGEGLQYSVGLTSEYWIKDNLAINATAGYNVHTIEFKQNVSLPISSTQNLITQYLYQQNNVNAQLKLGARYRVFDKVSVIAGTGANIHISETDTQTESVITPIEFVFPGNLQTRNLSVPNTVGIASPFVHEVSIGFSYDFSIANATYVVLQPTYTFSVNSLSKQVDWRYNAIGVSASCYFGIR